MKLSCEPQKRAHSLRLVEAKRRSRSSGAAGSFNNNLLWLRLIQVWGKFYGKKKPGKTRKRKKAISNGKKNIQ